MTDLMVIKNQIVIENVFADMLVHKPDIFVSNNNIRKQQFKIDNDVCYSSFQLTRV